jgi:hypothetical protein
MEWCIPIQTFQVDNIVLGSTSYGPKPTISLSYRDMDMNFSNLSILLPILPIKSYTPSTGRLILSLADSPGTLSKFNMLQEMILTAVHANQQRWFPKQPFLRRAIDIRNSFQSILQENEMNLYCPINDTDIQGPNLYKDGGWSRGISQSGLLSPGTNIRVVVKLQGISFHIHPSSDQWSGKFRLQHRILAILVPST